MTIGERTVYIDGRQRVTGSIDYVLNLDVPDMLHGKILRSPYPHARVINVDASAAEHLPGVIAVLTGADVKDHPVVKARFGPVFRDQTMVAIDKVRFAGDPVAAVAAVDLDTAEEALNLIRVEYEELPAVFDPREASRSNAPLVHDTLMLPEESFADIIVNAESGTNVLNHFKLRKGDVKDGFSQADYIFEDHFSTPISQHVNLEPHVCIAQVDDVRNVHVWSSTQTPYIVRSQLAEVFRVPHAKVRVSVLALGGGYGAKTYPKIEPLTAMLAWKAGHPVKVTLTRAEVFLTITKHSSQIRMKTGVKTDGTIVAREVEAYWGAGAYGDISPRLIKNGGFACAGPYKTPHVKIDSYAVYTNLPPAGAFRGYGVAQAAWAYETQMDMIAHRLEMDAIDFRLKNFLVDGDMFATGQEMKETAFARLTRESAQWIGWGKPSSEPSSSHHRRGKGVACVIKGTITPSTSVGVVRLNADGSVMVLASTVEMGQGSRTTLAQIAATQLGVPLDSVRIADPDTDVTPFDLTTSSSRSTFSMGTAITEACRDVQRQLREAATRLGVLEKVNADDLEVVDGGVQVKDSPELRVTFTEVLRATRMGEIIGRGSQVTEGGLDPDNGQGIASIHWHQAAAASEVEVDIETGKIELLRLHSAVYTGRTVNPIAAELQCEGSQAFGQGNALLEEMVFDSGQLVNGNLADYMVPSMQDTSSERSVTLLEDSYGEGEVHGIGETGLPPVPPAIGNAVANAIGVRITDLPITPEKVLRALEAQYRERGL